MLITPPAFRSRALAGIGVVLLVVVFCLGLVHANPRVFWNDDYQISILPVLADVARAWHEGHWPLLSPYSWACGNLAGEYQYGTFSLFVNAVVVAVWTLPMSFANQAAALSITHLVVLALGAFALARQRRLPVSLATMVATVAALNGWNIGWSATNWFGALAADAWLPWCWWAFEVAMREPAAGAAGWASSKRMRLLLPGLFVYLVLTGGFPYTVVRLGLLTLWLAVRAWTTGRRRAVWPLVTGWALGLGLSAPAWLSLLEAMHGSSRSQGAGAGNFAWTVPLGALPGLILPNWTTAWHDFANRPSTHAALELAGGFVPVAGLVAAFVCLRGKVWHALRWDLALLGTVLLLCLVPSPGVFRWSFRWLPLFHLVLALTAARALHLLASRRGVGLAGNPGFWASVLAGTAWLAMGVFRTANHDAITHALPLWTCGVGLGWFVLAARFTDRRGWRLWVPAVAAFVSLWATYAHMYTNPGLPRYPFGESLTRVSPLSPDRLYLSLYREPYHFYCNEMTPPDFGGVLRMGSTGMFAGVHTINGYSPIMPKGIGQLLDMETHGSIPDAVGRRLLTEEAGPAGLLARIGVDGLLVARNFPLEDALPPADEWEPVFASPEGTVYHRRSGPLPEVRAWEEAASTTPGIVPWNLPPLLATDQEASVRVVENSRAGTVVEVGVPAAGPGDVTLAFRRAYFPGYVADLNGVRVPVGSYRGLLPTVTLPAGSHGRLTLRYRPRAVVWGGVLAALSLLCMVAAVGWEIRHRQRKLPVVPR